MSCAVVFLGHVLAMASNSGCTSDPGSSFRASIQVLTTAEDGNSSITLLVSGLVVMRPAEAAIACVSKAEFMATGCILALRLLGPMRF